LSIVANSVNEFVVLVDDQVIDASLMGFKLRGHLVVLKVDDPDFTIAATDNQLLATLVECAAVCDDIAHVNRTNLLYSADVPNFDDAIGVSRSDVLATDGELGVVDGIQVSVESLDSESTSHIPNADSTIGRSCDEEVREGLEVQSIDAVSVLPVLLPNLQSLQVVQLEHAVSACGNGKVTCVMEFDFPDWSRVDVRECVSNPAAKEIPELQVAIAARSYQVGTGWVEVDGCDPVFVACAGHDFLSCFHVVDLPRAVVGTCGDELFPRVQGKSTDSFVVGLNAPLILHPLCQRFELPSKVRIWAGVFRIWRVLGGSAQRAHRH